MSIKEESKSVSLNEQKKMPPREQRILQRYGLNKHSENKKSTARSINELYDYRYKKKFR